MQISPTPIIIVTGHPATGKTTLANILAQELVLPLIWKDSFKETLAEALGWSTDEWSRKLSVASWALLYQQVEILAKAGVPFIAEGNFEPTYATKRWQQLMASYPLRLIQIRCETQPETLLMRYRARITSGERHPIHRDGAQDDTFQTLIRQGHIGWIDVDSTRLSIETATLTVEQYVTMAATIRGLL